MSSARSPGRASSEENRRDRQPRRDPPSNLVPPWRERKISLNLASTPPPKKKIISESIPRGQVRVYFVQGRLG